MNRKKGFTVIEILISIAIIVMMLSITFMLYQSTRAKGRDAVRVHDVKEMQNALDLYITDARVYPVCGETIINGVDDCLSQKLISVGAMTKLPTDPLHKAVGVCGASQSFVYCYESANGSTYVLKYNLETNSITGQSQGWHSISP